MPEGKLCNKQTVDTKEQLNALLSDKSGKQYYEELKQLDVDGDALWATIQKSLKSRLRTWLEICAHCGMCADSCFFYLANNKDPKQVPSYKIQSTLGAIALVNRVILIVVFIVVTYFCGGIGDTAGHTPGSISHQYQLVCFSDTGVIELGFNRIARFRARIGKTVGNVQEVIDAINALPV